MKPYIGMVKGTDANGSDASYPALILFRWRDQLYACPRQASGRFVSAAEVEHIIDANLDTDVFPPTTLEAASLGDYDSRMNIYRWWESLSQDGRDEFFGTQ